MLRDFATKSAQVLPQKGWLFISEAFGAIVDLIEFLDIVESSNGWMSK